MAESPLKKLRLLVKRMGPLLYTYDNANRLTQVQHGTSTVVIGYDDADRRMSLALPNGNSVTYAYDAASQLTSLTDSRMGSGLAIAHFEA